MTRPEVMPAEVPQLKMPADLSELGRVDDASHLLRPEYLKDKKDIPKIFPDSDTVQGKTIITASSPWITQPPKPEVPSSMFPEDIEIHAGEGTIVQTEKLPDEKRREVGRIAVYPGLTKPPRGHTPEARQDAAKQKHKQRLEIIEAASERPEDAEPIPAIRPAFLGLKKFVTERRLRWNQRQLENASAVLATSKAILQRDGYLKPDNPLRPANWGARHGMHTQEKNQEVRNRHRREDHHLESSYGDFSDAYASNLNWVERRNVRKNEDNHDKATRKAKRRERWFRGRVDDALHDAYKYQERRDTLVRQSHAISQMIAEKKQSREEEQAVIAPLQTEGVVMLTGEVLESPQHLQEEIARRWNMIKESRKTIRDNEGNANTIRREHENIDRLASNMRKLREKLNKTLYKEYAAYTHTRPGETVNMYTIFNDVEGNWRIHEDGSATLHDGVDDTPIATFKPNGVRRLDVTQVPHEKNPPNSAQSHNTEGEPGA